MPHRRRKKRFKPTANPAAKKRAQFKSPTVTKNERAASKPEGSSTQKVLFLSPSNGCRIGRTELLRSRLKWSMACSPTVALPLILRMVYRSFQSPLNAAHLRCRWVFQNPDQCSQHRSRTFRQKHCSQTPASTGPISAAQSPP